MRAAISRAFLNGILAALPLALTIGALVWIGYYAEALLGGLIKMVLPSQNLYWPGMGVVAGILLILAIGLVMNLWVMKKLVGLGEYIIKQIPFVKAIYAGLKDMMSFFTVGSRSEKLDLVVNVTFANDFNVIGFVTRQAFNGIKGLEGFDGQIAVYLPLSYQIGGYTVLMPRDKVKPLDMSVEDAMRFVVMAGMSGEKNGESEVVTGEK